MQRSTRPTRAARTSPPAPPPSPADPPGDPPARPRVRTAELPEGVTPPPGCRYIEVEEEALGPGDRSERWWWRYVTWGDGLTEGTRARVIHVSPACDPIPNRDWMLASGPLPPTSQGWLPPGWRCGLWPLGATPAHHAVWSAEAAARLERPRWTLAEWQPDHTSGEWHERLVEAGRLLAGQAGLPGALPLAAPLPASREAAHQEVRAVANGFRLRMAGTSGREGQGSLPEWVLEHFRSKQYLLMKPLWGSGYVKERDLVKAMKVGDNDDPRGSILKTVERVNDKLSELAGHGIPEAWEVSQATRDDDLYWHLRRVPG